MHKGPKLDFRVGRIQRRGAGDDDMVDIEGEEKFEKNTQKRLKTNRKIQVLEILGTMCVYYVYIYIIMCIYICLYVYMFLWLVILVLE